jgi:hypothetical protein
MLFRGIISGEFVYENTRIFREKHFFLSQLDKLLKPVAE